MVVTAFLGKPRTGKTLHMTMNAYFDYRNGRKIYSNYSLKFPHERLTIYGTLGIQYMEMEQSPKTICLQEADKWFDSRRSGREENVLLSSLAGQSGKRNIDILYDTQFPTRIDNALERVTDYAIYSDCITDKNKMPLLFVYQLCAVPFGDLLRTIPIKTYKIPAVALTWLYNLYDTYEPTAPLIKKKLSDEQT